MPDNLTSEERRELLQLLEEKENRGTRVATPEDIELWQRLRAGHERLRRAGLPSCNQKECGFCQIETPVRVHEYFRGDESREAAEDAVRVLAAGRLAVGGI